VPAEPADPKASAGIEAILAVPPLITSTNSLADDRLLHSAGAQAMLRTMFPIRSTRQDRSVRIAAS
jgi:hypothetical protein